MAYVAWYALAFVVGAFFLTQPEKFALYVQITELQLKRLWLLFRLWPTYQMDRLRIWFILRKHRHNQNSRKQL